MQQQNSQNTWKHMRGKKTYHCLWANVCMEVQNPANRFCNNNNNKNALDKLCAFFHYTSWVTQIFLSNNTHLGICFKINPSTINSSTDSQLSRGDVSLWMFSPLSQMRVCQRTLTMLSFSPQQISAGHPKKSTNGKSPETISLPVSLQQSLTVTVLHCTTLLRLWTQIIRQFSFG